MKSNWISHFRHGDASMKELLGGKGANLAEMTKIGLPVPPGFTITTDACRSYYSLGRLPDSLMDDTRAALQAVELARGLRFGDASAPLLISVRSGSVHSMPGMMDTILNLGLNDETVQGLAAATGDESFAYDCYRRLIHMFGNVVFGIDSAEFETILDKARTGCGASTDQEMTTDSLRDLVEHYKQCVAEKADVPFPQDVYVQLQLAIEAVFRSWNNHRAQVYRKLHHIPDDWGTAANIQSMVFGNYGADSGTGVVFTRHPSTGARELFGEYLTNAQGEDVVAGTRTPQPIARLSEEMPHVYAQLTQAAKQLEHHYCDMQDIEFTVERGKLFILQTRSGKRTAQAAVAIAVSLVKEGLLSPQEALLRTDVAQLEHLLHPSIATDAAVDVVGSGLPASPGAASGHIVLDADEAERLSAAGERVILVRPETTPEDIHGVLAAEGVLTSRGGMTSHAAVVARSMGKPCVSGCDDVRIDLEQKRVYIGERVFSEGDLLSIDGSTGRVIAGAVPLDDADISPEFLQLLDWADRERELRVYVNADTPEDAMKARALGAEGLGLCRTEHMFMAMHRLQIVQDMILAETMEERQKSLAKLLPMQQSDFEGIFKAMDGLTVTIRLLDPPLHEFMPHLEELVVQHTELTAKNTGTPEDRQTLERLIRKVRKLHETNPMLGQRGCRLGILFPEIYEMQVEALFLAARQMLRKGVRVQPDIMVPLVGHAEELSVLRDLIERTAERVLGPDRRNCAYRIGTMIEVPRAALTADKIAEHADFFSFGTNDLTQMTLGYSRDDAEGKFLPYYVDRRLLANNPFQVLDTSGVGQLIELAVKRGLSSNPQLTTGICGEHGGERDSIYFCHETGLDYVSCSTYRIPLARIAAAQAKLLLGSRSNAQHSVSM
ncbi:pyruvate, phosphate dikinase [Paenibacillus faecalis]|uniref:pyruvate, phosphate dikinase n=1 Tax=Paenibacillus faecalis TaxID=2079532 RepID=UPI000D0F5E75|nr:pyruvate, phosphate dikinase [Paenibacillus faecalis]